MIGHRLIDSPTIRDILHHVRYSCAVDVARFAIWGLPIPSRQKRVYEWATLRIRAMNDQIKEIP